jgi:hypothetical protein
MTETRPYHNEATQAERKTIVKNDSYFARQQNTIDDSGGRFAKLTPATITGSTPSPQYPSLPASSPWSNGFDANVEPQLGYAVDEMPQEIQSSEPALIPQVAASPTTEVDRTGEEPVIGSTVVSFPSTDEPVIGSSIKRRDW